MKKILLLLFLIVLEFGTSNSQSIIASKNFDVLNYTLNLNLIENFDLPYSHAFDALEEITLVATSSTNSVWFNASNYSIIVETAFIDAKNFTQLRDTLKIELIKTFEKNDTIKIGLKYKHKDVVDGSFFVKDGMLFTNNAPEGARNWFPCIDHPSDKATFSLSARVPKIVKLASNGSLIDSLVTENSVTYKWKSKYPLATYLAVISAKKSFILDILYWKNPGSLDSIPVRFYWNLGEDVSKLRNAESAVLKMLTYYSKLFGDFPFEKAGFVTLNELFVFGGMENQTLISLCSNCWDEELISHELSHELFGNLITPGTWSDIWLNEGFATFCEGLWYEHTSGKEAYKNYLRLQAERYFLAQEKFPIYNFNWQVKTPGPQILYNGEIIYAKSAAVLGMLRNVVGDSLFFKAFFDFATNPDFKFQNVTTGDFIQSFQKSTGKDLTYFFDQWLNSQQHPVYNNYFSVKEAKDKKWETDFILTQSNFDKIYFQMPFEIGIFFEDGTISIYKDFNDSNNQQFKILTEMKPIKIVFDPENKIVLKQSTLQPIDELKNKKSE